MSAGASRASESEPSPVERPESDLARLLEVESRIASLLAASREEAKRIVAAAESEAQRALAALNHELDEAEARLRAEIEAERDRAVARIREEAARQVTRFTGLRGERLAALADRLVERVLAWEDEDHTPRGREHGDLP